jgi:hypothetical protein
MARSRKQRYDPRQLMFNFDVMVDHMEHLRVENDAPVAPSAFASEQSPSARSSYDDDPLIRDIFAVSSGTVSVLLEREGFHVRMNENIHIVHDAWVNSQRTASPEFGNWQQSWDYFKRTGLFRSIADAAAAKEKTVAEEAPQSALPEYARLGMNSKGETVYALKDGSRMVSRDPAIMQTVDGDKDTPKALYDKGKRQYLTVEEVAAFAKDKQHPLETQHGNRRTDSSAGNRPQSSQAQNDPRSQVGRVHQFSLFDFGPLGAQQPGRTKNPGIPTRV